MKPLMHGPKRHHRARVATLFTAIQTVSPELHARYWPPVPMREGAASLKPHLLWQLRSLPGALRSILAVFVTALLLGTAQLASAQLATPSVSLTSDFNPSLGGQQVVFTAKVLGGNSPTGTVSFLQSANFPVSCDMNPIVKGNVQPLANGVAICSRSGFDYLNSYAVTNGGQHTNVVYARYDGDGNNNIILSPFYNQIVNVAQAEAVITSSVNPSGAGQTATLTAAVTGALPPYAPTGSVSFAVNSSYPIGCSGLVLASGLATCDVTSGINNIGIGDNVIVVNYSGDASNSQLYGAGSFTQVFLPATVPSAPSGLTAAAGNASISVAFTPGALGTGTLVNYTAACSSSPGSASNNATGTSSPITVSTLTNNGLSYTCAVKTTSTVGDSPWSANSNSVTPSAPTTSTTTTTTTTVGSTTTTTAPTTTITTTSTTIAPTTTTTVASTTTTTVTSSNAALNFVTGWNLLGNSTAAEFDVAYALGDKSLVTTVWKWDSVNAAWAFYSPAFATAADLSAYALSKGYQILSSIAPGQGFWVNAANPFTLTRTGITPYSLGTHDLALGWNLVSTGDSLSPAQLDSRLGGSAGAPSFASMWAWDSAHSNWYFYAPSLAANSTLASYIQSKGYSDFGALATGAGLGFWLNSKVTAAGSPIGRYRLATRGVWGNFERRGWSSGYYPGDMIQRFNLFDDELQRGLDAEFPGTHASSTVGAEVGLQLDIMRGWGINAVTLELRTPDPTYVPNGFVPPACNMPPVLGVQWPQPTPTELANLASFFDLAHSKGIRVILILNNTHMEENPPSNAQTWLGAILNVVKNHPALDVVAFGGNTHTVDTNGDGIPDSCGIPAEPPLWLGPASVPAQYVKWAIQYGISLGVPARKLSAETIIGDILVDMQPTAGTDGHLSSGIVVLKGIFDSLGIADNQRTYLVSFYEHRKCATVPPSMVMTFPCSDADPHTWAEQTIQAVRSVVGNNGVRIVAAEMGVKSPIQSSWPAERALESLGYLMEKYGVDGGAYWIWSEGDTANDASPDLVGEAIKRRGVDFVYNPVRKELVDLAGFHLSAIANGSFETGGSAADNWTGGGVGSVVRFRLADETGQPVVPSRGDFALRLTTGSAANDAVSVTSDPVAISPNVTYTTTANLRFQWIGDSSAGLADTARPQVYVMLRYFGSDGKPSTLRSQDIFRYYAENGSIGFGTFPVSYTSPADASTVTLEFGALRNGLAQPITLDVDNVR